MAAGGMWQSKTDYLIVESSHYSLQGHGFIPHKSSSQAPPHLGSAAFRRGKGGDRASTQDLGMKHFQIQATAQG